MQNFAAGLVAAAFLSFAYRVFRDWPRKHNRGHDDPARKAIFDQIYARH